MRTVSKELLLELFAEILHDIWLSWVEPLCKYNKVSKDMQETWKGFQKIYFDLEETQKAYYRDEARKFVRALERIGVL